MVLRVPAIAEPALAVFEVMRKPIGSPPLAEFIGIKTATDGGDNDFRHYQPRAERS